MSDYREIMDACYEEYEQTGFMDYDELAYARQGIDSELIEELKTKITELISEVDALKTRLIVYENKINILTRGSVN